MKASNNIFLVGLMGAGKTTVGRALARRLGKNFIDSDHEIEARTGTSISWIFEVEGEESFRRREEEVIRELTAQQNIVLATGGGAVLNAQNREYLKTRGTVIYLRASISSIMHRTSQDKSRPLLQTADPRKRLESLARQREPLYREVADIVIDTGRPNVYFMVQNVLHQLELAHQANGEQQAPPQYQKNLPITPSMTAQPVPIHLHVDLGERSYPIVIGQSLLSNVELMARHVHGQHIAIVTNTTVAPLYLERLQNTLEAASKVVFAIILPDGEAEKNWASLMLVFDALLTHKCDRKTTLIALGGGVIGDLTGYAAASYMRGVSFVQVPTTLLAQVDSSVGGKTGINHPLGKNMIGAFYQPQAVLADTATLDTLPQRELSAGLAEVIKHGAIIDAVFFNWIETNIDRLMTREASALAYAIERSCEIKASIVRQDEREGGLRAVLNFGHTFGHAIESGLGYGTWLHGEAVGCGMVMAADLSCRMGLLDVASKMRITALVRAAGLPVVAPSLDISHWLELMLVDKKNEGGQIKFILLNPLGTATITTVPEPQLIATLHACMGK